MGLNGLSRLTSDRLFLPGNVHQMSTYLQTINSQNSHACRFISHPLLAYLTAFLHSHRMSSEWVADLEGIAFPGGGYLGGLEDKDPGG
jgi:hypothetical protein